MLNTPPVSHRYYPAVTNICLVSGAALLATAKIAAVVFALYATEKIILGSFLISLLVSPACIPVMALTAAVGIAALATGLYRMCNQTVPPPTPLTIDALRQECEDQRTSQPFLALIRETPAALTVGHLRLAYELHVSFADHEVTAPLLDLFTQDFLSQIFSRSENPFTALLQVREQYVGDESLAPQIASLDQLIEEFLSPENLTVERIELLYQKKIESPENPSLNRFLDLIDVNCLHQLFSREESLLETLLHVREQYVGNEALAPQIALLNEVAQNYIAELVHSDPERITVYHLRSVYSLRLGPSGEKIEPLFHLFNEELLFGIFSREENPLEAAGGIVDQYWEDDSLTPQIVTLNNLISLYTLDEELDTAPETLTFEDLRDLFAASIRWPRNPLVINLLDRMMGKTLFEMLRREALSVQEQRDLINQIMVDYVSYPELGGYLENLNQMINSYDSLEAFTTGLAPYQVADSVEEDEVLAVIHNFDPNLHQMDFREIGGDFVLPIEGGDPAVKTFFTALKQYTLSKKEAGEELTEKRATLSQILFDKVFRLLHLDNTIGQIGVAEDALDRLYMLYFRRTHCDIQTNSQFAQFYCYSFEAGQREALPFVLLANTGHHFTTVVRTEAGVLRQLDGSRGDGTRSVEWTNREHSSAQWSAGSVYILPSVEDRLTLFPEENVVIPKQTRNNCYLASAWLTFCAFLHYHEQVVAHVEDAHYRPLPPN